MTAFKELIEGYAPPKRKPVARGAQSYQDTEQLISRKITGALEEIKGTFDDGSQTHRLLRDELDFWIRRYQDYSIRGNITAHYFEVGVPHDECVFEHVLPLNEIREMLLDGRLTVIQAINSPVCMLRKTNDDKLTESGLVKSTPNRYYFFKRYTSLQASFKTYNGHAIATPETWSLEDHYKFFGITV